MKINSCHESKVHIASEIGRNVKNEKRLHRNEIFYTLTPMSFEKHKHLLNQELDQFNVILGEILPRYVYLVRKDDCSKEELKELGEIEHYLIEVNSKISSIKNRLDQDLFGETMDLYYKVKAEAIKGDPFAQKKFDRLRSSLHASIKGDKFFNWN